MRGYQRKVVYLKNIGSSVFEEVYFVMKPGFEKINKEKTEEPDFITEANRIIEESVWFHKKRKKGAIGLKETLIFMTGFLISSVIMLLVL